MKNKKKIACIFNYAPHYRKSIFQLMAREFDCDFYFGKNLPHGEQLKKMDLTSLPGFKKESKVFSFRWTWQCGVVRQALRPYDIYILTGSLSLSNLIFMLTAKLFNKKVLLWAHGLSIFRQGRTPIGRLFFKAADGYFLYSNFGKNILIKYGVSENKLYVVYNSLDYDKQLEVRNRLVSENIYKDKFKNEDPVIIFSGRLLLNKKIKMILETQKLLLSRCPFNLIIVGDGPRQKYLESKADELKLTDRVWFYGPCYEEQDLGRLFFNAAITVSPGNVGLTAIHSLMYGTPIITHNNRWSQMPEVEAIKEKETGLLFKEDDVSDLAEKVSFWIINFKDRDSVRKKCYEIVDKYYNPYYQIKVMKQALEVVCNFMLSLSSLTVLVDCQTLVNSWA